MKFFILGLHSQRSEREDPTISPNFSWALNDHMLSDFSILPNFNISPDDRVRTDGNARMKFWT